MLPHLTLRPTAQITEAHRNLEQLSIVDTEVKDVVPKDDPAAKAALAKAAKDGKGDISKDCLLYTSPSPRD